MFETSNRSGFLDAVRREWWLPLLTVAVAVAIGLAASSADPTPLYEGTAIITVDTAILSKYPDLPRPDDVVAQIAKEDFISSVASESVLPTETIKAGLRSFTTGDTQSQVAVTFRSTNESEATTVAAIAATQLRAKAIQMGGPEVYELGHRVEETERSLAAVRKVDNEAGSDRGSQFELDLVATQWQMRIRLYEDRLELRKMQSSYFYNGNIKAVDIAPVRRRGATVSGAIVLGLALGFALAVFREAVLLRPRKREKAEVPGDTGEDAEIHPASAS
ncbi:MAG: hypothetical protein WBI63_09880 [Coriobacteriia bacterium]